MKTLYILDTMLTPIRAGLTASILFMFLFFSFYLFYPKEGGNSFLPEQYFLKGELSLAEKTLESLGRLISVQKHYLYRAYIARAKGSMNESNRYLQLGIEEGGKDLLYELYLNQMLNAYLDDDQAQL